MFALCAVTMAACSGGVVMQNPTTGQTVECGPYFRGGIHAVAAVERERMCVQDFKAQGYVRR